MMPRRVNDAQVERLLDAMRDVKYRAALAEKLVKREGVKRLTATGKVSAEWKRRYSSTMRRFQRYVTTSGQKRSFARAPVQYQREARAVARAVPMPLPAARRLPEGLRPSPTRLEEYYDEEAEAIRQEDEDRKPYEPERDISLYDLRAIVAYYDGDIDEAAEALGITKIEVTRGGRRRTVDGARLLELATQGVDVGQMPGGERVKEGARELFSSLPSSDVSDIDDFHDLLMNLPDWQIGMILADLEDEETTFADWLDAWRDDGMDLDADDSEYWALWRQAYKRAKA